MRLSSYRIPVQFWLILHHLVTVHVVKDREMTDKQWPMPCVTKHMKECYYWKLYICLQIPTKLNLDSTQNYTLLGYVFFPFSSNGVGVKGACTSQMLFSVMHSMQQLHHPDIINTYATFIPVLLNVHDSGCLHGPPHHFG